MVRNGVPSRASQAECAPFAIWRPTSTPPPNKGSYIREQPNWRGYRLKRNARAYRSYGLRLRNQDGPTLKSEMLRIDGSFRAGGCPKLPTQADVLLPDQSEAGAQLLDGAKQGTFDSSFCGVKNSSNRFQLHTAIVLQLENHAFAR
jgi:hypothetical protein